MVERMKSAEDAALEAMFRGDPLPDDGFSARVVARIRRRVLLRRWLVPSAVLLGGLVAARPASDLLSLAFRLLLESGVSLAPALQPAPAIVAMLVPGALLMAALLAALRMLDG